MLNILFFFFAKNSMSAIVITVVVLTNGSTFSAGKVTTEILKQLPHVIVIGDITGGGEVASSGSPPETIGEYKLPSGKRIYIGTGYIERYDGKPFE
jgi:C-terminal processing protease CtpA/Prc